MIIDIGLYWKYIDILDDPNTAWLSLFYGKMM